jgi:hypothetical protein
MAESDYVLGTAVKYGAKDGEVVEYDAGTSMSDVDLDDETVGNLWAAGSIVKAGSPEDPNTWNASAPYDTTPALVQDVLMHQGRHVAAGVDVPPELLTQPATDDNPVHEDPHSLLIGEQVPGQKELVVPTPAPSSAGGPGTVQGQAVLHNAESDPNTEGTVQAPSPSKVDEGSDDEEKKAEQPKKETQAPKKTTEEQKK